MSLRRLIIAAMALTGLLVVGLLLPGLGQTQSLATPPEPPLSAPAPQPTTLPLGAGLPVVVRTGLSFVDVEAIDENAQTYAATVDLRLRWKDARLAYPPSDAPTGYQEWRGEAATDKLAEIWTPDVDLANRVDDPSADSRSLRIFPDGQVEMLRRVTAVYKAPLDVTTFPFDHQALPVEIVSRGEPADRVSLDYRQEDLEFSRARAGLNLDGWAIGRVTLTRDPLAGWYGETYSRLRAALDVGRDAGSTVAGLFIPLLASLLIPLLATWLQSAKNGEFQTEAFELTNIVIGGLFAVIALNFTVNTDRAILANGQNTVAMLFGLNYVTLALALGINIALFRFNAVRALAGRHVQHEAFTFITWALPLTVAATAVAIVLIAAV